VTKFLPKNDRSPRSDEPEPIKPESLAELLGAKTAANTESLKKDRRRSRRQKLTQPTPKGTKQPRSGKLRLVLRLLFWVTFGLTAGGAAACFWVWRSLESSLPDTASISSFVRGGTTTIKASNGAILQQIGPATREKVKFEKIPPKLAQAFIASEDRRFYQHEGVDYQGVARAIVSNVQAGDVVEGGSTLTQQLARIVFLNQEQSVARKLREALLAQQIEKEMGKDQILERYLNLVYLGSGAYGVADAAWVYFSKPLYKLTLPEMATIAGLPPAPSVYSPLVNQNLALQRRNLVLDRMVESGFITTAAAETAKASQLNLKPSPPKRLQVRAPYFTSYVQQELPKYISPEAMELGGLTVETTINVDWQNRGEAAVKNAIELDGPGQGFSQAALVAIDPRTGEVKVMVGGMDYGKSQFNRVTQAQRQPGSTFKAFVYATSIATGASPYDGFLDAPYRIDGYEPQNAGRNNYGWLSLREALTQSVNVIAVKVLVSVGFEPVIKLAHDMGIKSELKPTYSLALGASEVNLLELTSAYGTFATQGNHVEVHSIRRILNSKGVVLYDANLKPKRVLDKDTAAIMTWMLQNVVLNGTGSAALLNDRDVAGKTGTSENARDLWFVGYIPQLVTGVWLGNDDNYPTWGASSTAAYTWHQFMANVVKGMPVEKFPALPVLEGRKGSIKAKPIGGNVTAGSAPTTERSDYPPDDRPLDPDYRPKTDSENTSNQAPEPGSSHSNPEFGSETTPPANSAPEPPAATPAPATPAPQPAPDFPVPTLPDSGPPPQRNPPVAPGAPPQF